MITTMLCYSATSSSSVAEYGTPSRVDREMWDYFFRMGKHREWLIEYVETHPDFILPENRPNEVLGYLRRPLGDLCISRPAARVGWGIPLPFDPGYVTYVWFDALLNYVTAAGYLSDDGRFSEMWPSATHVIGKDILITHAVYWPTMLRAVGLPPPRTILAHPWWLLRGAKMSKSRGVVVKPLTLAERYGVDALRFYLMSGIGPGRTRTSTRMSCAPGTGPSWPTTWGTCCTAWST